jgi:thioesterase domain-containing protein
MIIESGRRNNVVLLARQAQAQAQVQAHGHVFCVHAGDGAISQYRTLARLLAPAACVYGVTAFDLETRMLPVPSLRAIAAGYVDQVRHVQPSGPYHLAGWSSGGLLAYEMACQLAGQGEQVGSVTALDTWPPQPEPWRPYDTVCASRWTAAERTAQWHFFLGKLLPRFHALAIADLSHGFWKEFGRLSERDKLEAVRALGRDLPGSMRLPAAELAYVFDVVLMHACASARYQPCAYDGVVDVYVTDFESRAAQTLAYWKSMPAAAIVSRGLPGDHTAVIELPGVTQVAAGILTRVRAASA